MKKHRLYHLKDSLGYLIAKDIVGMGAQYADECPNCLTMFYWDTLVRYGSEKGRDVKDYFDFLLTKIYGLPVGCHNRQSNFEVA